ncbi:MAG: FapA family protein [Thermodesulfobacteriota bacterium]
MTESDHQFIVVACAACQYKYKVPEGIVGRIMTCKQCGEKFTVRRSPEVKPTDLLIRIALEGKLITEEKLKIAYGIQAAVKKAGRDLSLEEILIKKEMISRENMRRLIIATIRQLDKQFARIAAREHHIPEDNIQQALSSQAAHFKATEECILIGDILVAAGHLTPEQKTSIMAAQQRTGRFCALLRSAELKPAGQVREETQPHPAGTAPSSPGTFPDTPEAALQARPPEATVPERPAAEPGEMAVEPSAVSEEISEKLESKKEIFKDKKFFNIRKLDKELIGMAIAENLLTRQEGDRALAEQLHLYETEKKRVLVGDLLVADGVLTAAHRDRFLEDQHRYAQSESRFCEIAVAKGWITKDIAEKALSIQTRTLQEKRSKIPAGEILMKMKLLTNEQWEAAKAEQAQTKDAVDESAETTETFGGRAIIAGHPFEIHISEDRLRAVIRKIEDGPVRVSAADIRSFLADQQIVQGIVDDAQIEAFLKNENPGGTSLVAATGKPCRVGRAGTIKYYFNTEHLTVGAVNEDGSIDYKNRGEIPHVSKGELIAEKIPMISGETGVDIFGELIPVEPVADMRLKEGAGVELSADGMRAFAAVDGQPVAYFGGKVAVLSEIHIKGDIGLETGHVEFDGNVRVNETIQSGFRVRAANISAKEIVDADIQATGDVIVSGGITGGKIKAQGMVQAKYIKNAVIAAFGDVVTQKEIIDSTIETSGVCIVRSGKIISSEICAKKGVEALDVGTDVSTPSKLKIDVDKHLERELQVIKEAVAALQEKKTALEEETVRMKEEEKGFEGQIALLAQEQDRAEVEIRALKKNLSSAEATAATRAEAEAAIKALQEKARRAEAAINALFEKQDVFAVRAAEIASLIREIDQKIQAHNDERDDMMKWAREQKGSPAVKVRGVIYEGTSVFGPHASIILRESRKHALIKEVRLMNSDQEEEWEMRVSIQKN